MSKRMFVRRDGGYGHDRDVQLGWHCCGHAAYFSEDGGILASASYTVSDDVRCASETQ